MMLVRYQIADRNMRSVGSMWSTCNLLFSDFWGERLPGALGWPGADTYPPHGTRLWRAFSAPALTAMLNLSNLRNLLLQVLALPELHTVALFTPEGQLVSFAADPRRPKDNVRVIVGLGGEVWKETKQQSIGMVDSEVGSYI